MLIIAHRGASHDAPENTLPAFALAWQQGADGIEADFHLTKDGHIICIHDDTTTRTTGETLQVNNEPLSRLRQLQDATGHPILPTFQEVAATVPPGKYFFIELKCGPDIIAPLKKHLPAAAAHGRRPIIIAFNPALLAALQPIPHPTLLLIDHPTQPPHHLIATARQCGAAGLGLNANIPPHTLHPLSQQTLAANMHCNIWTTDNPHQARHLKHLGITSLTTNKPALLRALPACA